MSGSRRRRRSAATVLRSSRRPSGSSAHSPSTCSRYHQSLGGGRRFSRSASKRRKRVSGSARCLSTASTRGRNFFQTSCSAGEGSLACSRGQPPVSISRRSAARSSRSRCRSGRSSRRHASQRLQLSRSSPTQPVKIPHSSRSTVVRYTDRSLSSSRSPDPRQGRRGHGGAPGPDQAARSRSRLLEPGMLPKELGATASPAAESAVVDTRRRPAHSESCRPARRRSPRSCV